MNKTKTKKLQKPIESDIHLKYRCRKCGLDHWLSYREASTKNFKVVCSCGSVFKVKRLVDFKLKYESSMPEFKTDTEEVRDQETEVVRTKPVSSAINIAPNENIVPDPTKPEINRTIPVDLLEKSVKLLLSYGFTKTEATKLVTDTYFAVPVNDYATLVKYTLQSLGELENGINDSSPL